MRDSVPNSLLMIVCFVVTAVGWYYVGYTNGYNNGRESGHKEAIRNVRYYQLHSPKEE